MISKEISSGETTVFDRVSMILDKARTNVVRKINTEMVQAYWLIGREIVEVEQGGENRAGYGKSIIEDLSRKLTVKYGKGFSVTNLRYIRLFYIIYQNRSPEIQHPMGDEFKQLTQLPSVDNDSISEKGHPTGGQLKMSRMKSLSIFQSGIGFHPDLSWSHYRALMRVENVNARNFYEQEAATCKWTKRQLERQIQTFYYERLLKSRKKDDLKIESGSMREAINVRDILKDPYVLEFLDLAESEKLRESDLESALISRLQEFLLELGGGFAFIARQKRITLDGDHFYPDLIFYQTHLKCFVIIDLKVNKLTHGDLGQMLMYVNYFDSRIRGEGDNSTVGLILCTEKNEAVVRYVLGEKTDQIFASRFRLVLPSEEELRIELERERQIIESKSRSERFTRPEHIT